MVSVGKESPLLEPDKEAEVEDYSTTDEEYEEMEQDNSSPVLISSSRPASVKGTVTSTSDVKQSYLSEDISVLTSPSKSVVDEQMNYSPSELARKALRSVKERSPTPERTSPREAEKNEALIRSPTKHSPLSRSPIPRAEPKRSPLSRSPPTRVETKRSPISRSPLPKEEATSNVRKVMQDVSPPTAPQTEQNPSPRPSPAPRHPPVLSKASKAEIEVVEVGRDVTFKFEKPHVEGQ